MSPDEAIDRILELSAEAHARRRGAGRNSATFHKLTGAVLAYGAALDLLTKLRKERNANKEVREPRWLQSILPLALQVYKRPA